MAQLATAQEERLGGKTIEGRYKIGRMLGKGACGIVHKARATDEAFANHGHRNVAIKMLAKDHVGDESAAARFTHEAFLSCKLKHRNLVRGLDYGMIEPGRPYFVMEECKGVGLDHLVNEIGVLPRNLALQILSDVAQALAVLHAHGIVHRDVKPSNIFCGLSGRRPRARLLDLGVAGVFDVKKARKLGSVDVGAKGTYGTPAYIAPEQALGLPTDGRADVYALACVAYRMFTGMEAFRGKDVEKTIRAHLFDTARAPSLINPALPAALDAVFERALCREPHGRTPSVTRFIAELTAALED